jgi:hypothetical protein
MRGQLGTVAEDEKRKTGIRPIAAEAISAQRNGGMVSDAAETACAC